MTKTPRIGIPPTARRGVGVRRVGWYERVTKPALDRVVGLVVSVVTLPIVLILMAMAAISFGGAIDRNARIGRGDKRFTLYRIRTGHRDARDVRGRRRQISIILRQWSLDELPQVWNVALGHMSLVGPRPIDPVEAAALKEWQLRRHEVRPGLTGLWQVEARGDGRQLLDNVHYDIQYIDQISLITDLRILGMTLGVWAARREGQHLEPAKRRLLRHRIGHLRLTATDMMLWPIAITAAVYARYDYSFGTVDWSRMIAVWLVAMAAQLAWGYGVGLYRGRWRLGSFEETAWVGIGATLITLGLLSAATSITALVPRGAIAAAGAFHVVGAFVARYVARAAYTRKRRSNHQRTRRLIVFGAGRAGVEAVGSLREDPMSTLEPVAFLDDDRSARGSQHLGLPVVGDRRDIAATAERYDADYLLVAIPSAPGDQIREITDLGHQAGLQVEVLPPLTQSLSKLLVQHARSSRAVPPVHYRPAVAADTSAPPTVPTAGEFDLAVIGLGYVGLPAALEATKAGLRVLGLEIDVTKVEQLIAGISYIGDITDQELAAARSGGFQPTTDPTLLTQADVITISVPTPLREGLPDLKAVIAASEVIGDNLRPGQTVILESTTYPGTTDDLVRPVLEERSGLTAGIDFYLAYSPERIDPGNEEWGVHNTPKLVGGFDEASAERAAQLYGKFAPVVVMSGTKEAEMAKLLENTYRHVNIALVNEMAIFCDLLGVDIWETIRGAATKPFGFQAFYPGPGVGGHCIPIDPNYLSYRVRQLGSQFQMIELAQEINDYMPSYVARRAMDLLVRSGGQPSESTALILGVAYKPDVEDVRETPATALVRALRAARVQVVFADPLVAHFSVDGEPVARAENPVAAAATSDLVIIHTPHSSFDLDQICATADLVLDTRGVTSPGQAEQL